MAKLVLTDLSNGINTVTTINANYDLIEAAIENTLSRDGTSPNHMTADLDMNSSFILNLPNPTDDQHAANKIYVDTAINAAGSGITPDITNLQLQIDANAAAITANGTAIDARATITYVNTVIATEQAARASAISAVESGYQTADTAINNQLGTLTTTVTNNTASINTNASTIASANTAIATNTTNITANTTSISTLTTDVGTLTTSVTSNTASISTNASAITTLNSSVASNTTQISANTTNISTNATDIVNNTASITTNATAITNNTNAIATASTELLARASSIESSLIKNAFFQESFVAGQAPPHWTAWDDASLPSTYITRTYGDGFAMRITRPAGNEDGVYQDIPAFPGQKFLLAGEVTLELGTLESAGVLVQWFDSGFNFLGQDFIDFDNDATTSGVVAATPSPFARWEKEVTAPASTTTARLYAMSGWGTLGSSAAANTIVWRECNLTPVTNAQAQSTLNTASITTNATAIADESSARATYDAILTASVSAARSNGIIKNPQFQEIFSGTAVPPQWSDWVNGNCTFVTRSAGPGYAMELPGLANEFAGVSQLAGVNGSRKYLLSAEVVRILGGSTLDGAGVHVEWYDGASSFISSQSLIFSTEATTTGTIDNAPDGVVRWEKEIISPANAALVIIYAMSHWVSLGSTAVANSLRWRECNLTPVSLAQAQVTRFEEVYATDSASTARLMWEVNTGTNAASLVATAAEGYADGTWNGSAISLTANEIILNGNVLTTGTVARTSMNQAERDALGAEGTAANFYRQASDPAPVPDGSWWADTNVDELKIRIASAWQTIANISAGGESIFKASISGTAIGNRVGGGPVTSNTVTASFSNGQGGPYTYRWATNPALSSEDVELTAATSASTAVTATIGSTDNFFGGLTVFITDATSGQTAVASTSYSLNAL